MKFWEALREAQENGATVRCTTPIGTRRDFVYCQEDNDIQDTQRCRATPPLAFLMVRDWTVVRSLEQAKAYARGRGSLPLSVTDVLALLESLEE
jgi:hypothetical protein